ncbi:MULTISPECIES: glycosyltransferase [Sphingobacterium]|uniref:Glycosyltransferase n=1 Tax=Sphingobacterium populi TaxID=1812824 RepID=A0ABW5UDK8_9SPHI|nr:glycosyltransferase [Sphingobacterium sp. CFCC 11742]
MKIQFVITDYGSFNNFLGDVAVHLIHLGHRVQVVCSLDRVIDVEDHYDYLGEGILFDYVDFPRGFNLWKHWQASRSIHKLIAKFNPDVVSIHFTTGIFTTTFRSRLNVRTIGTFHGLGYPAVEGFIKRAIYKIVESHSLKRIDQSWVLNRSDYDLVKNEFPTIDINLLKTKGLGCNLGRFNKANFTDVQDRKLRDTLGIKSEDFVVCFTGRFVFFKGFDKVVRAFSKVMQDHPEANVKLLLIGGNDRAHPSGLNEKEERWIHESEHVKCIGFTKKVEEYLSISDLFLFPSEKEGMPVCIIEALAMGVPIITTSSRGCADLVVDGKNGIVLKENTIEEIAKQLFRVMSNRALINEFKANIEQERPSLGRNNFVQQQANFFQSLS